MAISKKPYKGTRDFFPEQKRIQDYIFSQMHLCAQAFGYQHYDGPLLEEVELYQAKSGEELINEQIYSFVDRGERFVAIRPEMTPTLARMVAQIHRETPKPIRWYSIPNLYRYERPQRGRLREHWQFNVDIFGAPESKGETEILQLALHFLTSLGATSQHFEICLNDRMLFDAIFKNYCQLDTSQILKLYKIVDKSKKVSQEVLQEMIAKENFSENIIEIINEYLGLEDFKQVFTFLEKLKISNEKFKNFINSLDSLKDYIKYDPSIVRGLDYYTGVVFEIFDKNPENRRAICGGGSYGNLLQIFNEPPLPAVGLGLGDVTLTDFLITHNLLPDFKDSLIDLYLTFQEEHGYDFANQLAMNLRRLGLNIELSLESTKPKKVFTQAENKGHHFVAFIGAEEITKEMVQIKNLKSKEQKIFSIKDTKKIQEFLKGLHE